MLEEVKQHLLRSKNRIRDKADRRTAIRYLNSKLERSWRRKFKKLKICSFPNSIPEEDFLTHGGYAMSKILSVLGINARPFDPWGQYDIIIHWQDLTCDRINSKRYIEESYLNTGLFDSALCVNFNCNDISKKRVGKTNHKVFGYALEIDPLLYNGKAVEKSNFNSMHDGAIIDCPIRVSEVHADRCYCLLVDNDKDDFVIDHRLIYIRGFLDFFYEKHRPIDSRFSNTNSKVYLRNTAKYFTQNELATLEQFCELMGADYAELDVLRDNKTGRIYVVDIAKTPAGPPNGLSRDQSLLAIGKMAEAFAKAVIAGV
jgi:hypothetical protein